MFMEKQILHQDPSQVCIESISHHGRVKLSVYTAYFRLGGYCLFFGFCLSSVTFHLLKVTSEFLLKQWSESIGQDILLSTKV